MATKEKEIVCLHSSFYFMTLALGKEGFMGTGDCTNALSLQWNWNIPENLKSSRSGSQENFSPPGESWELHLGIISGDGCVGD